MGRPVSIRSYEPRDLDACRALWRELTQRHRDIYDDQTIGGDDPGPYFDTHYLTRADLAAVWVAERDGEVIGLTGLLRSGDDGEVEPLVVSAPSRPQGIGSQLIAHVIAEAKALGLRHLSIRPVARNVDALRLFHREGFRALGHLDMFMDLSDDSSRRWKTGVSIHDKDFRY